MDLASLLLVGDLLSPKKFLENNKIDFSVKIINIKTKK
jgi:hypothetical protein